MVNIFEEIIDKNVDHRASKKLSKSSQGVK